MWSVFHDTDIFMITTNPIIKNDGSVVMGRGIAAEAKEKFPSLPFDFGTQLCSLHPELDDFNVGLIGIYEETPIWFFMVKTHWIESASLDIIKDSVFSLANRWDFSNKRIDLNFPGIGNGKLRREDVLPLLLELPDNVHIWEKE